MTVNSFRQIPLWRQQTREKRLYPQIAFLHGIPIFYRKELQSTYVPLLIKTLETLYMKLFPKYVLKTPGQHLS